MTVVGNLRLNSAEDLDRMREELLARRSPMAKRVRVCMGPGCAAKGAARLYELFCEAGEQAGADVEVQAKSIGCHGLCECGPIVIVEPGEIFYQRVEEPDVPEIFRETVLGGRVVERLLHENPATGEKALAHNGVIDPASVDDYIAEGGYTALAKVLTSMGPEDVIVEVERAGLRGRGGGGFATARKWRSCRKAKGSPKYVICNGDLQRGRRRPRRVYGPCNNGGESARGYRGDDHRRSRNRLSPGVYLRPQRVPPFGGTAKGGD
ncbi:MAG: (2Fe-2S) ferredoxin domain-containing protein [Planctomycetota bacterium]